MRQLIFGLLHIATTMATIGSWIAMFAMRLCCVEFVSGSKHLIQRSQQLNMDIDMLTEDKNTIWMHEDDDGTAIVFAFDTVQMDHQEMFMKWVEFMNAIGY